jgi:hypothetical protein
LLLLVGVVVFMAGLFGLYAALQIRMPFVGLLFLLYWGAIMRQDRASFLASVFGGVGGILLARLLLAPPLAGTPGTIVSYGTLAAVLFCYMRGQASLVVNNSTMLFLAVSTIPELNVAKNVLTMTESLLLGAAYLGAISAAADLVKKRFIDRGAPTSHTRA